MNYTEVDMEGCQGDCRGGVGWKQIPFGDDKRERQGQQRVLRSSQDDNCKVIGSWISVGGGGL
jgi:hypothetical protein